MDHESGPATDVQDDDDVIEQEHDFEAVSLISSMMTSAQSKLTLDDYAEHEGEDVSGMSGSLHSKAGGASSSIADKVWVAAAAHKAKTKWITFLTASVPKSPGYKRSKRRSRTESFISRTAEGHQTASTVLGSTPAESILDAHELRHPSPLITGGHNNSDPLEPDQATDPSISGDKGVYDSSAKQRVPSWFVLSFVCGIFHVTFSFRCDRILWKTTVEPDPESETALQLPSRSPMMHVLQALRPLSLRTRKDSEASINSLDATRSSTSHSARPSYDQRRREELVEVSILPPHGPPLLHLKAIDSLSNLMRPVLSRTTSHAPIHSDDQSHSRGVPIQHTQTINVSSTTSHRETITHSMTTGLQSLTHSSTPSSQGLSGPRWLGFFPFLHRDHTLSSTAISSTAVPSPRRGDIVCLEYRSLDDRAMHRLEGRSDHRPVIGSYAVYL